MLVDRPAKAHCMYMKATSLVAVAALVVFASASTIHATDRQPAATECGEDVFAQVRTILHRPI